MDRDEEIWLKRKDLRGGIPSTWQLSGYQQRGREKTRGGKIPGILYEQWVDCAKFTEIGTLSRSRWVEEDEFHFGHPSVSTTKPSYLSLQRTRKAPYALDIVGVNTQTQTTNHLQESFKTVFSLFCYPFVEHLLCTKLFARPETNTRTNTPRSLPSGSLQSCGKDKYILKGFVRPHKEFC